MAKKEKTTAIKPLSTFDQVEACYKAKPPTDAQLEALKTALNNDQDTLARIGNLTNTSIQNVIDSLNSPTTGVIVNQYIKTMRRDLNYYHAPKVVQLATDAVILAWLHFHKWEEQYNHYTEGTQTLTQAAFWDRRMAMAQNRYLQALTTLARVQKLARRDPALQVNIAAPGSQQANFTGDYVKGEQVKPAGGVVDADYIEINETGKNEK